MTDADGESPLRNPRQRLLQIGDPIVDEAEVCGRPTQMELRGAAVGHRVAAVDDVVPAPGAELALGDSEDRCCQTIRVMANLSCRVFRRERHADRSDTEPLERGEFEAAGDDRASAADVA